MRVDRQPIVPMSACQRGFRKSLPVDTTRYGSFEQFEMRYTIPAPVMLSKVAQIALASQAQPLSDSQRLENVQAQAKRLFTQFKDDPAALLQYLQQQYGVTIVDAAQTPWAKELLTKNMAHALFYMPSQVLFPGQTVTGSLAKREQIDPVNLLYGPTGNVVFIFNSQKMDSRLIFHEAFHFLQFINGLSFFGDRANYGLRAADFKNDITIFRSDVTHPIRWLKIRFKTVWSILQRYLGRIQEVPNGFGAHCRIFLNREVETHRFCAQEGRQFGLSVSDWLKDRFSIHSLYKPVIRASWLADQKEAKGKLHFVN